MSDPALPLKEFKAAKKFFVGIDSDGCAFDTMELKHKECFIPNIVNVWELQAISKYTREAAEFVNLYSKWRGCNRFPGLLMVFDLLAERPEVKARGVSLPEVPSLRKWVDAETKLSSTALEKKAAQAHDPVLNQALKWSDAVNDTVAKIVRGVPPFPFVRESLEEVAKEADVIVVSATPCNTLNREWKEHGIDQYVKVIAGQEMGNKKEHLNFAAAARYEDNHVLMVGDAPGDMNAAKANNALFYPINPGKEEASWEKFYKEAFKKFINLEYAGEYEEKLIAEFDTYLPETPPWKK